MGSGFIWPHRKAVALWDSLLAVPDPPAGVWVGLLRILVG